ncbi:MAG: phosphatidylcholine/phosphatidylserine synthase [Acidobacteria bacterium]|nr:phosphatidylcholine/phosphatidylserine synthase [Acidobacteriota bacterium]
MPANRSHARAPRRGAYLLPSLFTVANIFCGYFALTESFKAGRLVAQDVAAAGTHFDMAAKAIGVAVLFDGMDGWIARQMGTSSAFGKELDSMADTITFGIAPAFLAFSWGVQAVLTVPVTPLIENLTTAGWLISFLFVICSVSRLARFNIQGAPASSPASRPVHRHFVGLPTPASAGLVAAIVHVNSGNPMSGWLWVPFWLLVLLATSLLMVSRWRYYSFKSIDLQKKRKFVVVIGAGGVVALIWFYSHVVLLIIAVSYLLSGALGKVRHLLRRNPAEALAQKREV